MFIAQYIKFVPNSYQPGKGHLMAPPCGHLTKLHFGINLAFNTLNIY